MVIEWLGHSCFKITLESDLRILTDPYGPEVGYTTKDGSGCGNCQSRPFSTTTTCRL